MAATLHRDNWEQYAAICEKEITSLKADRDAWKIIAEQNDNWNKSPQSEKEATLQKALESTMKDYCDQQDEIERLQKTIGELASNRIENERLQAVILRAENIFSSLASAARDENMYNLAKICADYESEMRGAYEQEVKTK